MSGAGLPRPRVPLQPLVHVARPPGRTAPAPSCRGDLPTRRRPLRPRPRRRLHVGGDNWSADAAIRVIEADPAWRGMLVSLGGSTSWATCGARGRRDGPPGSDLEISHLPFAARTPTPRWAASSTSRPKGIRDETLIVITADHAAQTGDPFFGRLDGPATPSGIPATRERLERPALELQLVLRPGRKRDLSRSEPGDRRARETSSPQRAGIRWPTRTSLRLSGRSRRRLARGQLGGCQARGRRGGARHARRDRELPAERRRGRLRPVQRQQPDGSGADLVRASAGSSTPWPRRTGRTSWGCSRPT